MYALISSVIFGEYKNPKPISRRAPCAIYIWIFFFPLTKLTLPNVVRLVWSVALSVNTSRSSNENNASSRRYYFGSERKFLLMDSKFMQIFISFVLERTADGVTRRLDSVRTLVCFPFEKHETIRYTCSAC